MAINYNTEDKFAAVVNNVKTREVVWTGFKTCTKCEIEQPLENFNKNRDAADGYRNVCKTCRSTAKPKKPETRKIAPDIWFKEAAIECPCAVCGNAPALPNTVPAAREWLLANLPLCEEHIDGKHWKAILKARQWYRFAEERLLTIEAWHDVSFKIIAVPRVRSFVGKRAAAKWMSGNRSIDYADQSHWKILLVIAEAYDALVGASTKPTLPSVLNVKKIYEISNIESHASDNEAIFNEL